MTDMEKQEMAWGRLRGVVRIPGLWAHPPQALAGILSGCLAV